MNPVSIVLLGLAMSTDAFAAALGKGAGMLRPRWPEALRIGLIFGVVEGITPVIGWLLGSAASRYIEAWDHWIAFGMLGVLGLHMIYKAATDQDAAEAAATGRLGGIWSVALTGLATSIDAMAVGVGLAFVDVNILVVAVVIGLCTLTMVTLGIMAGRALGMLIGKRAEMAGGVILILVGATILYEHLHAATA
ncbi:manganese efflux pump MntP family protein [Lysobacter sp. TAF61]|uniref:manganese efflux pump MntP n=1 Tax=Lysobacter sp. TAF61 TaxID=3233072 RepID=UPI003F94E251